MVEILGMILMALGTLFFVAGSVGLLRFPDVFCRLHALTKADGLGLALICASAALGADSWGEVLRIALVWAFVALAGVTGGHMIARHARRSGTSRQQEGRP